MGGTVAAVRTRAVRDHIYCWPGNLRDQQHKVRCPYSFLLRMDEIPIISMKIIEIALAR
jgi:hypothetical protein